MVNITDLLNNLLNLLDKYYPRKKKNQQLHQNGVLITDNNREVISTQSLSANSTLITGLSTVATSGDYRNLTNTPTKLSDFNIDNNFTLDYDKINNRPTKLTDLNNNGFTLSVNSLTNLNNLKLTDLNNTGFTLDYSKINNRPTKLTNLTNDLTLTWNNISELVETSPSTNTNKLVASSGLKTAIDGKADNNHNHDTTYLKLSGGILTGSVSSNKSITTSGNIEANKIIKTNSDNNHILLGNGDTKEISYFATNTHNHDDKYIRKEDLIYQKGVLYDEDYEFIVELPIHIVSITENDGSNAPIATYPYYMKIFVDGYDFHHQRVKIDGGVIGNVMEATPDVLEFGLKLTNETGRVTITITSDGTSNLPVGKRIINIYNYLE